MISQIYQIKLNETNSYSNIIFGTTIVYIYNVIDDDAEI
jgi:hypothetical protein